MKKRGYRQQAHRLAPEQAAYIAGFIDGEGCITASIRKGHMNGLSEFRRLNRRGALVLN